MTNRLAHASSPYLLQHAQNPVDWYSWGPEALEAAKRENKPIFLSIGYAACHWCHVMAHESFEDPTTAGIMNAHFINIKVDREERLDLDSIYMSFVVAVTGQGGWPMSVFLTPDGKPFYGGTYFPPTRRHNLPSFREVLEAIARLWKEDRDKLVSSSEDLTARLQANPAGTGGGEALTTQAIQQAVRILSAGYDWQHGGWGVAPKFPQPMLIEFLLQHARQGDQAAKDLALHALDAMAQGGMYDVLGGGFARYSVDATWLVPHFEKMLYDNAQLARVYLHAHQLTGNPFYREVCTSTLDFVLRELTHILGGFYSSLDADSEGEEGKFYLWSADEIREELPDQEDYALFTTAYGIHSQGNFEGRNILRRAYNDEQLAAQLNLDVTQVPVKLASLREQVLQARNRRVRPGTDDKVLVSWNAMMLGAFAEAGAALGKAEYSRSATRNANFILEHMREGNRLKRSWRAGTANHTAYLEDHASLGLALLSLYQVDPDPRWYQAATGLLEEILSHFRDPSGGFFDTRDDHEALLYRPKDLQDNATPSGNALTSMLLLRLAAYEGRSDWRSLAEEMLSSNLAMMLRYPTAFAQWLSAANFALGPVYEVAVLGDPTDQAAQDLLQPVWRGYQPHLVLAASTYPPPEGSPPLLTNRPLMDGKSTAYVCQGFVCQKPVNNASELMEQIS